MNWRIGRALVTLVVLVAAPLLGQTGAAPWVVRPEWVKAHEEFLASDALAGRGSATRDEQLAAVYVASEFEGYGLRFAPGMTSYLQSAAVDAPVLDGHATLTAGTLAMDQGTNFDLVMSSGNDATGTLVRVAEKDAAGARFERGAAVLLTGATEPAAAMHAVSSLRRRGAALVLLPGEGALAALFSSMGGQTRLPVRLAGEAPGRPTPTVVLLHAGVLDRVLGLPDGASVSVKVHRVPSSVPRLTYNAIGYLPGTDRSAGTLLLTAHLDHLGVGQPVNGDAIYNGANDDAAGTTAVLELAHALAAGPRLRRSILFVCYGSEEVGELGSTYFGEHPPVPLKELVANLEFEMIGNQDPKMPKDTLLLTGWERSDLGPTLRTHGALLGPDPYPEEHFFERSDNYALALKGVVAHTAAGWGTVPTYHQPDDDLQHLDLPFMTAAIQSLVEPVRWLASSDFVPHWKPGGQPKGR